MIQNSNLKYLKPIRRKLRQNQTKPKYVLWQCLRNRQLEGRKFRRQFSIGNFIYDFCCVEEKILIEIDGEYIHADKEIYLNGQNKERLAKKLGFKLLRYSNKDILTNLEAVLNNIKDNLQINLPHPTSPLRRGGYN